MNRTPRATCFIDDRHRTREGTPMWRILYRGIDTVVFNQEQRQEAMREIDKMLDAQKKLKEDE